MKTAKEVRETLRIRPRESASSIDASSHSTPPRLKVFVLTAEALTELGHGRKRIRWPKDAIVLKDLSDLKSGMEARWLVYSGSFPELEQGQPAPACYPAMEPVT